MIECLMYSIVKDNGLIKTNIISGIFMTRKGTYSKQSKPK